MSAWNNYLARMNADGADERDMWVNRSRQYIRRRSESTPSLFLVTVNGCEQRVSITHRTVSSEKRVCSLPGEHLKHGGVLEFLGSKWLITDVDANSIVYDRGLMRRCNHVLRWIGKDGKLHEKWCVVEDGTKYLIGEATARYDSIMTIGDARIALTVGKDEETTELTRGLRFLIDDTDVDDPLAYQITKSNRFFNAYDGEGVFRFILNEVTRTENDDLGRRIADFKSWTPGRELDSDHKDSAYTVAEMVAEVKDDIENNPPIDTKRGWL